MKSICKKIIAVLLCISVIAGISVFSNEKVYAEIKELAINSVKSFSSIISTPYAIGCDHQFYVYKSTNATCTTKGTVTLKCRICGANSYKSVALGHLPKIDSVSYRRVNYVCGIDGCTENFNEYKNVEDLLAIYKTYVNQVPDRMYLNNSGFLDVVNDGIINAKDYAYLLEISAHTLSNPNANKKTNEIYQYLCKINGEYTLSAQQESTWMGSPDYEINYIYNSTGKYPAMRGLDYMNDDFKGVNQRAIEWWNKGGLVTICWHTGSDFTGEWNDAQNDSVANWDKMLTEGTKEYKNMIAGMDKAAKALLELQNAGVTVLWRPFHEFDGGWFWWGKGGSANFIKMWHIMYKRYTEYWGLNNLIWVLGYCHNGVGIASWYVGDDYFDIIGADSYDKSEFTSLWTKMNNIAPNGKPVCLHECGENPTVSELDTMPFSYFMTWHTEYLTNTNTNTELKRLYNSDRVITLDELEI